MLAKAHNQSVRFVAVFRTNSRDSLIFLCDSLRAFNYFDQRLLFYDLSLTHSSGQRQAASRHGRRRRRHSSTTGTHGAPSGGRKDFGAKARDRGAILADFSKSAFTDCSLGFNGVRQVSLGFDIGCILAILNCWCSPHASPSDFIVSRFGFAEDLSSGARYSASKVIRLLRVVGPPKVSCDRGTICFRR